MYAIIDVETTGARAIDKITEIAIYIHDGNKIIDEFVTLINPEVKISPFITNLTGITNQMVENAPKFYEVAKKIVEVTNNKIFVAHNASFDYNIIRNEFKSLGYEYKRNVLCTVKLSRKLIPALPSYSLGNLCDDLGIKIEGRHRAGGDALATVKLLEYLFSLHNEKDDLFAGIKINSLENIHSKLDRTKIEKLPEETGVYYFYDERNDLIYVGKSNNIYNRVLSHFNNTKSRKALEMRDKITDIDYELTGSELVALLIESEQIKQNQPFFNRAQRRAIFNYGIFLSTDEFGYLCLKVDKTDSEESLVTSFNSIDVARKMLLKMIEKYSLCQKLCNFYKSDEACFHYSIGQCRGACIQKESVDDYNQRVNEAIKQFEFQQKNFFIIDKGKTKSERSVIKIQNGKYIGIGYVDISEAVHFDSLHDCINKHDDNRDIQQIIKNHLQKNKMEKIITY